MLCQLTAAKCYPHHPDIVLMDIRVPRLKLGAGNRVQIALLVQDATASRPPGPP